MVDDKHRKETDNGAAEDRLAAVLGLMADKAEPDGPAPDLHEIQDWHLGKLDQTRAKQVKTHIARDPACFQMWTELMAAESPVDGTMPSTTRRRGMIKRLKAMLKGRPRAWVEGGVIAAAALVLVVMILPRDQGIWSPADQPMISDVSYDWPYLTLATRDDGLLSTRQKAALQVGIREGLGISTQGSHGWQLAIDNLTTNNPSCENADNKHTCEQANQLLNRIGVHAAVHYIACLESEKAQTSVYDRDFWLQQRKAWRALASQLKQSDIPALSQTVQIIGQQAQPSKQCRAVRDLLHMAH